ncbi:MAG TPA: hypothetical protein VLG76_07855 [Rhabdochlamydiaceae bacterium]|nr:hypothetical protein [Rhabdochlamydiaceae bacterium]
MPDFTKLFTASKAQPTGFNGKTIFLADKFPVENGDILVASIEKSNSDCRQGFSIDITGHCEMNGELFKQGKGIRMVFWADTAPEQIKLKIFTKQDFVRVYNVWEQTNYCLVRDAEGNPIERSSKSVESGYNGAAMIVEEIENGRRYSCNDGTPDENFDDIVFTIQKLK